MPYLNKIIYSIFIGILLIISIFIQKAKADETTAPLSIWARQVNFTTISSDVVNVEWKETKGDWPQAFGNKYQESSNIQFNPGQGFRRQDSTQPGYIISSIYNVGNYRIGIIKSNNNNLGYNTGDQGDKLFIRWGNSINEVQSAQWQTASTSIKSSICQGKYIQWKAVLDNPAHMNSTDNFIVFYADNIILYGKVFDKNNSIKLNGAIVSAGDISFISKNYLEWNKLTRSDGVYELQRIYFKGNNVFQLKATLAGYNNYSENVNFPSCPRSTSMFEHNISLQRAQSSVKPHTISPTPTPTPSPTIAKRKIPQPTPIVENASEFYNPTNYALFGGAIVLLGLLLISFIKRHKAAKKLNN